MVRPVVACLGGAVMTRTYSLAEVAEMVLPPEWKQPELWLMRRLRRGEICGYKVGHSWRMRQADVDALIETYLNTHAPEVVEPVSVLEGLSARAKRRLAS